MELSIYLYFVISGNIVGDHKFSCNAYSLDKSQRQSKKPKNGDLGNFTLYKFNRLQAPKQKICSFRQSLHLSLVK